MGHDDKRYETIGIHTCRTVCENDTTLDIRAEMVKRTYQSIRSGMFPEKVWIGVRAEMMKKHGNVESVLVIFGREEIRCYQNCEA